MDINCSRRMPILSRRLSRVSSWILGGLAIMRATVSAGLWRRRHAGVLSTALSVLPASLSGFCSNPGTLFLSHRLEPTLAADLTTFAAYGGHICGNVRRWRRAVTASGPSTSFVERSTIHLASWFGSRGRLPLPTVMILSAPHCIYRNVNQQDQQYPKQKYQEENPGFGCNGHTILAFSCEAPYFHGEAVRKLNYAAP